MAGLVSQTPNARRKGGLRLALLLALIFTSQFTTPGGDWIHVHRGCPAGQNLNCGWGPYFY
jgi:hypothetical protein